jgi:hypothetical protein
LNQILPIHDDCVFHRSKFSAIEATSTSPFSANNDSGLNYRL